jgi:nucleoid DNA-binding protein
MNLKDGIAQNRYQNLHLMKDKKDYIYLLATKYNLPLSKVEEIINYQFKFVERIMKKGKFEGVRLPYFGKFHVNKNRLKHIKKLSDDK